MSLHVPYRRFNRSQASRINGSGMQTTTSTFLNVDSPRVQRDIARHSAIGAVVQAGAPIGFTSDGYLYDGLQVTYPSQGLVLNVAAGSVVKANGTKLTLAADTVTLGANNTTPNGPRIDVICVDTSSAGDIVAVAGTTAGVANANLFNRLSMVADLPANRIPIALVLVPSGATNLDNATIVPLR